MRVKKVFVAVALSALASGAHAQTSIDVNNVQRAIALSYMASVCKIRLNAKTEAWTSGLVQAAPPQVNARAVNQGQRMLDDQISQMGRKGACTKLRRILKQVTWL